MSRHVVVKLPSGVELPLTLSINEYKVLLADNRTPRGIRFDLENGNLPSLPRRGHSGEKWRIPTGPLLEMLGIPYTVQESTTDHSET